MLASFAEYERETIRERTRAGLHRAYRGGRHFGVVPYGYRTDDQGRLQVVPEEAKIVREIISNVTEGPPSMRRPSASTIWASRPLDGATATARSVRAPSSGPS
jgi:DNA invertase Pin-like site-specific DNA recombinase